MIYRATYTIPQKCQYLAKKIPHIHKFYDRRVIIVSFRNAIIYVLWLGITNFHEDMLFVLFVHISPALFRKWLGFAGFKWFILKPSEIDEYEYVTTTMGVIHKICLIKWIFQTIAIMSWKGFSKYKWYLLNEFNLYECIRLSQNCIGWSPLAMCLFSRIP